MERCLACEAVESRGYRSLTWWGEALERLHVLSEQIGGNQLTQRVTPINAPSRGPAILHGSARLSALATTLIVSAGFPDVTGSLSGVYGPYTSLTLVREHR